MLGVGWGTVKARAGGSCLPATACVESRALNIPRVNPLSYAIARWSFRSRAAMPVDDTSYKAPGEQV